MAPGGTAESMPKLVPGGTEEFMPKLVPGGVLGVGTIVGGVRVSCDVGYEVGGCRHVYGTSGGCGFLETGAGMGRGVLV